MDRGVKLILAASVVTGGIAMALLFRHPQTRDSPPLPGSYEPTVLRQWIGAEVAGHPGGRPTVRIRPSYRRAEPMATSARPPTVLTPIDPGEPPPPLADSYPHARPMTTSRWGTSMAFGPPGEARSKQRPPTHMIVDGDTLPALAKRYLGNADRYMEIFEANRCALPSPEVLPIGVELTIPDRRKGLLNRRPEDGPDSRAASDRRSAAENADLTRQAPLVPVPDGSVERDWPRAAD